MPLCTTSSCLGWLVADDTKQVVVEQHKEYFYYKKTSRDPLSLQIFQIEGSLDILESQITVFSSHLLCVNYIKCFPFDLSSWEHLRPGIGVPEFFPPYHGCYLLSWKPHPLHFCFETLVSWADKGVQCCQLARCPSCPSVLLQTPFKSVGRGVGGVMPGWGSSKAACLKEGSGCLGQNGSGQAAGNSISEPTDALT